MLQHRKMAGTMRIINRVSVRMAVLPSFPSFSVLTLWLLSSVYSVLAFAHDPGLSLVDIELADDQLSAHITYAKADIEQFILLDKDKQNGVSLQELTQANAELKQFISAVIEFSNGNEGIQAISTEIELDNSDGVHFKLQFLPVDQSELTIHSRMIDKFALGHRQFVKVKIAQGLISSRILSARDPLFQVNLPRVDLWGIFNNFIIEGIWHIWIGFDHILFVLT